MVENLELQEFRSSQERSEYSRKVFLMNEEIGLLQKALCLKVNDLNI